MATRSFLTVFGANREAAGTIEVPKVFNTPIRNDLVHQVHTLMAKNRIQAHAVSSVAGEQTSAESWGTGRAVARIPRVRGGGTHRSGQAAFGNMCRGGRMFAPKKTTATKHHRISATFRHAALHCALAATAQTALVLARGHRADEVPELPLVISKNISLNKTREAVKVFQGLGLTAELERSSKRSVRSGGGKRRNRTYKKTVGPIVIIDASEEATARAVRNIPGVDVAVVDSLNLLRLAPGGHIGRLAVFTETAMEKLNSVTASHKFLAPLTSTGDIHSVINSTEIQQVLRPAVSGTPARRVRLNPLTNKAAMAALNPAKAVKKN